MDGNASRPPVPEGMADRAISLAGSRPGCLAFVLDDASEAALRGGLPDRIGRLEFRRGDIGTATRFLARQPTPGILLVDISGTADPVAALDGLAAVCAPDVRVLVIGEQTDIGLYRRLTRELGVVEYLHKPLTRDMVALLFAPPLVGSTEAQADTARNRGGQIVAVCGARGGCGATTIAVNLAAQLAESGRSHVALLDLHLRGGNAGLMLGARSSTGLRVALEEPDRADALFLDRVGVQVMDRLRLIAAEEPMESEPRPTEIGVQRLLDTLRFSFNFIVVDLPMPPGPAERMVLAAARHSVLVLGPDVANIRDTLALRKLVDGAGSTRATIVLNRANLPGGLKRQLVQEGLGSAPDVVIPDLPRHVPRAANLGRPAVRESTAFRQAMAPLLQEIAAKPAARPVAPLRRLFGWARG